MDIVIATGNPHKVAELSRMLAPYSGSCRFISMRDAGFSGNIEENAPDFKGNALIKARAVCKATGLITIADDSGLCVDALGGAPGVYSARYAGEPCDDAKNNEKLLSALAGVPWDRRTAHFVCVIAAAFPDGEKLTARGECPGVILENKRGRDTFGYDPLFFFPPYGKTFAELTADEKNGVSHRGRAVKLFCGMLFTHHMLTSDHII